eukprot:7173062-Alexandrium_andersonii.AAC.1
MLRSSRSGTGTSALPTLVLRRLAAQPLSPPDFKASAAFAVKVSRRVVAARHIDSKSTYACLANLPLSIALLISDLAAGARGE